MKAIVHTDGKGPDSLALDDVDDPTAGPGEVLIDVAAAGVNRADLLQSQGLYPPPADASGILGLECSGTIAALGEGVVGLSVGDPVCALLSGGGYAEKAAVPAGQVMPAPEMVSLEHAGALPEVACTVWSNLVMTGGLGRDRLSDDARSDSSPLGPPRVLIHGGAGGIGSHAIRLCTELGARVATTAGTPEKVDRCRELGAELALNYREDDFADEVRRWTADDVRGQGVDLILDVMGAKYLAPNISALAEDGRLIVIGMQGGISAEINLAALLTKRAGVVATNLRRRPATGLGSKADICSEVQRNVWPMLAHGALSPDVTTELPLAKVGEALRLLESGESHGKILLTT